MDKNVGSLEAIGFKYAGKWELDENGKRDKNGKIKIKADLDKTKEKLKNVLYAFVVEKEVKYVGKTILTLKKRMGIYRDKGKKLPVKVETFSQKGVSVDIYVLSYDNVNKEKAGLFISDVIGLEKGMIREFELTKKGWNIQE